VPYLVLRCGVHCADMQRRLSRNKEYQRCMLIEARSVGVARVGMFADQDVQRSCCL
jgi:hypothetical protein